MSFRITFCALSLILAASAHASGRFSGEKGVRPHRSKLAAGGNHTCAILDDGSVQCWGDNSSGQLGDGSLSMRTSPVTVVIVICAVSIAAGQRHTCALTYLKPVSCWGNLPPG